MYQVARKNMRGEGECYDYWEKQKECASVDASHVLRHTIKKWTVITARIGGVPSPVRPYISKSV